MNKKNKIPFNCLFNENIFLAEKTFGTSKGNHPSLLNLKFRVGKFNKPIYLIPMDGI